MPLWAGASLGNGETYYQNSWLINSIVEHLWINSSPNLMSTALKCMNETVTMSYATEACTLSKSPCPPVFFFLLFSYKDYYIIYADGT